MYSPLEDDEKFLKEYGRTMLLLGMLENSLKCYLKTFSELSRNEELKKKLKKPCELGKLISFCDKCMVPADFIQKLKSLNEEKRRILTHGEKGEIRDISNVKEKTGNYEMTLEERGLRESLTIPFLEKTVAHIRELLKEIHDLYSKNFRTAANKV